MGGLVEMVEKTVDLGRNLVITSEQTGLSTDALFQWQSAAKLSGVEADELAVSLRFLQRNAYEAATAGGEAGKHFAALGIHVKNADGTLKDGDTLLREMADGLEKTEDPAKRVALATQLLGRGGARMLPVLSKGSKGIEEMKEELEQLGISFDTSWTEKAEEAHKEQIKFGMVLASLRTKLALQLLPAFTRFFGALAHYVGVLNKAVNGTNAIKAALVVLGAIAAVVAVKILLAFAPLILSTLAWAAAIGIIVLAIDEIITTLEGGDSILRRWIDDTWGAGSTDAAVKAIKDAWDELVPALEGAWHWLSENLIPSLETTSRVLKALGDDIAFVVDQFRHLSEFKEGIAKIGHDIGVKLGLSAAPADEQNFAHGAEGFGSASGTNTATGVPNVARGGEGFFSNFSRFAGDAGSRPAVTAPPGFIGPPAPPGNAIHNNVTVNVAANAKPDPALKAHITGAVQDALGAQNRKVLAAVQGT